MQWRQGRRSSNVEDRRGMRVPGGAGGIGAGAIVLALIAWFVTKDPSALFAVLGGGSSGVVAQESAQRSPEYDELADFASAVLADTEDTWREQFAARGAQYRDPTLVLFEGAVESACGTQDSAVGPFYCPLDERVYVDLSFYHELKERFGAPGDFAQAYVIAHEVGHHVQALLGTLEQVHSARQRMSEADANELSVRSELQADFYAGVWAHHAERSRGVLELGDLEEALNAANQIGDDTLQRRAGGRVVPDSFTHGTAEQRARWFRRGFESGRIEDGDTFNAREL